MIGRCTNFGFNIGDSLVNPQQRFDVLDEFVQELLLPFMPHQPGKAMQMLLKTEKINKSTERVNGNFDMTIISYRAKNKNISANRSRRLNNHQILSLKRNRI